MLGKPRVDGSAGGCPRSVPVAVPSPLCPWDKAGGRDRRSPKGGGQEKGLPELGRGSLSTRWESLSSWYLPETEGISQGGSQQSAGWGQLVPLPPRDTAPFDWADQIGAALHGNIVVSLNVLPKCIYLPIPSPPSLRNLLRSQRGEKTLPGRRRMEP